MSSIVTIGGGTTGCSLKTAATGTVATTSGTAFLEITNIRGPLINMGERDVTHLSSGKLRDWLATLMDYTMDFEGHFLPDKANLTAQPIITNAIAGTTMAWGITYNDPTTAAKIDFEGFIRSFEPMVNGPDEELMFSCSVRGLTALTLTGFATT